MDGIREDPKAVIEEEDSDQDEKPDHTELYRCTDLDGPISNCRSSKKDRPTILRVIVSDANI